MQGQPQRQRQLKRWGGQEGCRQGQRQLKRWGEGGWERRKAGLGLYSMRL